MVDGAVAVGEVAVACPKHRGEFLVGDCLAGVGADGHASADGLFHDDAGVDWWWELDCCLLRLDGLGVVEVGNGGEQHDEGDAGEENGVWSDHSF